MKKRFFVMAVAALPIMVVSCGKGSAESEVPTDAKTAVEIDTTAQLSLRMASYLSQVPEIVWEQQGNDGEVPVVVLYADSNRAEIHRNSATLEDFNFTGRYSVCGDTVVLTGVASSPAVTVSNDTIQESWPQELKFTVNARLSELNFTPDSWVFLTAVDPLFNKCLLGGVNSFKVK